MNTVPGHAAVRHSFPRFVPDAVEEVGLTDFGAALHAASDLKKTANILLLL